jgi:hypothetical protein
MKLRIYLPHELLASDALSSDKTTELKKIEKAVDEAEHFNAPDETRLRNKLRMHGEKLKEVKSLVEFNSALKTALFKDMSSQEKATLIAQIPEISQYIRSPGWRRFVNQCLVRELRHSVIIKDGANEIAVKVEDGFDYEINWHTVSNHPLSLQCSIIVKVFLFVADNGYYGIMQGTANTSTAVCLGQDVKRLQYSKYVLLELEAHVTLDMRKNDQDEVQIFISRLGMRSFIDNIVIEPGVNFNNRDAAKADHAKKIRDYQDSPQAKAKKEEEERRQAVAIHEYNSMTDEEFARRLQQETRRESSSSSSAIMISALSSSPHSSAAVSASPSSSVMGDSAFSSSADLIDTSSSTRSPEIVARSATQPSLPVVNPLLSTSAPSSLPRRVSSQHSPRHGSSPSPQSKKNRSQRIVPIENSPIRWDSTSRGSSVACSAEGLKMSVAVNEWQETPFKRDQTFSFEGFDNSDVTANGRKIDVTILPQSRDEITRKLSGEANVVSSDVDSQVEQIMREKFRGAIKRILFGEASGYPQHADHFCRYVENSAAMVENLLVREARYSILFKDLKTGKEQLPVFPKKFYSYEIKWNLKPIDNLTAEITVYIYSMMVGKDLYVLSDNKDGSKSACQHVDKKVDEEMKKPLLLEIKATISTPMSSVSSTSSSTSEQQAPMNLKLDSIVMSTSANNLSIYPGENRAKLQARRRLFQEPVQINVQPPVHVAPQTPDEQFPVDLDYLISSPREREELRLKRVESERKEFEKRQQAELEKEQAMELQRKSREDHARLQETIALQEAEREAALRARNNPSNDDDNNLETTPPAPVADTAKAYSMLWHGVAEDDQQAQPDGTQEESDQVNEGGQRDGEEEPKEKRCVLQ